MRCKECESEISDSDVFCPYCGISLRAEPAPPPPVNDELASTIVMPYPPKETAGGASAIEAAPTHASEPPTPQVSPGPETERESTTEPETPAFVDSMPPTVPDIPVNDIPVPAILNEELARSNEEPEIAKTFSQGETPTPPGEVRVGGDLPPYPEKSEPSDPEIGKPVEAFETPDPFASPAIFDSVRIMEPPAGQQDFINTRLGPNAVRPSADLQQQQQSESAASGPVSQDARPYTAPNIGMGDTDGKKAAKLKPLAEGTVLNGRYEIVRKIGGGGMGAVYLASDNNLGGVLRAVKEMVQAHIEEEQQDKAINDFKRESMILSTLDHPSIPTIFDYFYDQEEGRFYLVMKYISGGDLAARLRAAPEGKIDEKTVTEWAIQIADVLDYLHSQPTTIVYRDLKPSNIMLDGNTGRIMLIDFGIARSIGQKQEKGVTAVGTMGYAPPELFSGNVEPRSDIYSLGSTL